MKIYSQNWGFSVSEISCPVTLWHGAEDDVVDLIYANEMRNYLFHANLNIMPGEGHYSIALNYRDQIISDLLTESI